ncbi:MAG TPA: DUF1398 family protein [Terriglobales bacterium]
MRNPHRESEAGRLTFPQVIAALTGAGVESYFADLARAVDTFYLPTGETHAEKMTPPVTKIAEDFSQTGIVAAVRAARADEIRYPEFLKRAMADGIIAYWVFIAGRKVIHFGCKGEFHIEEFPRPKSYRLSRYRQQSRTASAQERTAKIKSVSGQVTT